MSLTISRADKQNTRYTNLKALGKSVLVSAGVAWLRLVTVNVSGGAANEIDIYDTPNETVLAAGLGNRVARIETWRSTAPYSLEYDVKLLSGLVVDVSGGVAGDFTVSHSP